MEPCVEITRIEELNEYCLLYIFDYLTLPERWIAGKVCARWEDIRQGSLCRATILDTFDPDWTRVFIEDDDGNKQIARNIMSEYGEFIQCVKSYKDDNLRFAPKFPCDILFDCCSRTQLQHVWLSSIMDSDPMGIFTSKFHDIVKLRIDSGIDCLPGGLRECLSQNQKLESVRISLFDNGSDCVLSLRCKPIRELIVCTESGQAFAHLITVLWDLPQIKILDVTYTGAQDIAPQTADLMAFLSTGTPLNKLRIKIPGAAHNLSGFLLHLNTLVELNVESDQSVTNEFLSDLGDELMNLKSLNISGCYRVSDGGLLTLSKLEKLEELYIDRLYINGEGLTNFVILKRLSCRWSKIFDEGVVSILGSCDKLAFLDISECKNVTMASLDHAIRVMTERRNQIILQMNLDLKFIHENRIQNPPLLQLFCTKGSKFRPISWDSYGFEYNRSIRNIGTSYYVLEGTIIFVENDCVQNLHISQLEESCLDNILSFISVIKRIRMKRVSKHWKKLIEKSWERLSELDTTTAEWKSLQHGKPIEHIHGVLDIVLKECGKNLKRIVLQDTFGIHSLPNHCKGLQKIIFRGIPPLPGHINLLAASYADLTEVRMNIGDMAEGMFPTIFNSNPNLKSVILGEGFLREFDYFTKLNPSVLETLHFNPMILPWSPQEVITTFSGVLARFTNLKTLVATTGGTSSELLIQAMVACRNLRVLILENVIAGNSEEEFTSVYNLKHLETLALRNYQSVNDELFTQLGLHCTRLSHIDITGCTNITDLGLQKIVAIPTLHTLIMEGLSQIKGTGLSLLFGSTFRHLECQMCYSILNDPICDVILNCSHLKYLNIVGCMKLDQRVIDAALEATNRRRNDVKLKLISDSDLVSAKRAAIAPLLDVTICRDEIPRR